MEHAESWCELCMCDDLAEARAVATTVAAMEFECRVLDASTGAEIEPGVEAIDRPCVVEVHPEDRDALGDVLEEIRQEQSEFDAAIAARDGGGRFVTSVLIGVLTLIVAILATLRLIEL
ncbi:MAG: hypothetical protein HKO59_07305 [Phycisphaerales bacterium]|nr:hypothetical protein [Phycisphaerae bacterium]NNF42066.1 hypothetical protein [Phycisphaerales bacterium]NNM25782.1 hypothetical protein [Phycisphaerales bacterium]